MDPVYDEDYYAGNNQESDRIALGWYAKLVQRYAPAGPVLDFGCGTGWLVKRLSASRITDGFELSPYARNEAGRTNPTAQIYSCQEEVPPGRYGAITSIHVVEHIPENELGELLSIWNRSLRVGGIVLLVTPDSSGRAALLRKGRWRGFDDPSHVTLRPHAFWEGLLRSGGFEVVASGTDGLWDPPYGNYLVDRARLLPIAGQVLLGRLLLEPGSGESALIVARKL